MTTRTTDAILRDITNLFAELTEAQQQERDVTKARISCLEHELDNQIQKQREIANILLR